MNNQLQLSFFDIQALNTNQDIKDELTLAFLHGLDLTKFIGHSKVDYRVLRGVRLCLEHDVPLSLVESNLSEKVLVALSDLYSTKRTIESSGLITYFKKGYLNLMVEERTFTELVKLALLDISFNSVDFTFLPVHHVPTFVSALHQGIQVGDLVNSALIKDVDYMEFLISLRQANIDISPFLKGDWSEDQIQAVILGRTRIAPVDLVNSYVNENFTAGQIEYALKSLDYGCADLVCSLDEDRYPIYNEYQMYNLVEGARFGLDYHSYANPAYNDYIMATQRNKLLLEMENKRKGFVNSQLSMSKVTKL